MYATVGREGVQYFYFRFRLYRIFLLGGGRGWGRDGEKPEDCIFQKVKMLSINKNENVQFQQNTIVEKTKFCLILINHHTDTV